MRRSAYAIILALVLIAIVIAAFFGTRFVIQRFRQDFQVRPESSTANLTPSPAVEAPTALLAPTEQPTRTPIVIPTPVAPTPEPYTPEPAPTSPSSQEATPIMTESEGPTAQPVETSTQTPVQVPSEPFQVNGAVRYSQGDCGGTYALGLVTDSAGERLPGVRLRLVDEYNNEAFAVTKAGQADLGRYDFPLAGPPRKFSLAIVDDSGSAMSRPVGFAYYGDSPDAQATCYWLDWQRR